MRYTKEIRNGMRDEIILSGPGYTVFHGRQAECFKIDGGIEDHKNHKEIKNWRKNRPFFEQCGNHRHQLRIQHHCCR